MPNGQRVLAVALTALLLAACGSRAPTAAENEAADAQANAQDKTSPSGPGPVNGSDEPDAGPVPPPDAVSHPDGYLPDAGDPASAPEPATGKPPDSREPPPATEDQYIRNRQTGS